MDALIDIRLCPRCEREPVVAGGYCAACKQEYDRDYYQRTKPERKKQMRDWHLTARYGISQEQYDEMLRRQGGVCAICEQPPIKHRLDVDHDHESGRVRGLLCRDCNLGVGKLKESLEILARAARYLGAVS